MGTDRQRWGSGERAGGFTLAPESAGSFTFGSVGGERAGNFTVGWGSGERAGGFTLAPESAGSFTFGWASARE
ncbi:MAG: hypothetical protein K0U69_07720 [Actinomycetia bacterium]|nr:hypothetical protein [Actinomycetes bacterium]